MRWLKWVGGIVLVLVAGVIALFVFLPAEKIANFAASKFEDATGRALAFEGGVSPSIWPEIGVSTGRVTIANADWAGDDPMVEADGISVGVNLMALISGDIEVTQITIDRPVIRLVANEDGGGNWVMGESDSDGGGAIPEFSLAAATVRDGKVIFTPSEGSDIRLDSVNLDLSLPSFAGPATLDLTAQARGTKVAADVTLDRTGSFLTGGQSALRASLSAGKSTIGFIGQAGLLPLYLSGDLNGDASDLAAIMGILGQSAPELPRGLGQNKIAVTSKIEFADDALVFRALSATLDQNRITGEGTLALAGERPKLTGSLALGDFDLSDQETGGGAVKDNDGNTTGWSKDPIDVSALGIMDADLALSADSFKIGDSKLDRTRIALTIENSRAVVALRELNAYDGSVVGAAVVNGRKGLSTSLDVQGSALAISRLLSELIGYDRLTAYGDMQLKVLGSGISMDALMNSLNGEGSFSIGAGEILGFDIVGLLNTLDMANVGSKKRTIFDGVSGSFRIVDGVVINEDLSVLAPLFKASGKGKVGIGGQTLNYRLVPELLGGDKAGLSVPLLITGTWDKPKFALDLESLVRRGVEQQLEQKVQDALTKGLTGALGGGTTEQIQEPAPAEVTPTEETPPAEETAPETKTPAPAPTTLEDAIKGAVQDEIKKGLGSLLGGN
ncbi:MAG: AsmA family protein [Paracoccaceae bacterium]|nr:AsmA family protein [Paracoccaceae bacterium]